MSVLPSCAVILDTSTSIKPSDLDMARTAAHYLARVADVTYWGCSDQATRFGRTLPETINQVAATDLRVGIAAAIADGARAVIVITDCETEWPTEEAPVPVIIGANRGATKYLDGSHRAKHGIKPWNGRPPEWMTVVPLVAE